MASNTLEQAADRIAEHVEAHALSGVEVVLHGGEPLLAGRDYLNFVCQALRAALPSEVSLDISVQTNGTLLDEGMLDVFDAHNVRIGLSLDGDDQGHDAHRGYRDGRGSHADTTKALALLLQSAHRGLFAGFLSVVDPRRDAVDTYERLVSFSPPSIDFLLPHANWSRPPLLNGGFSPGHYGRWLVEVFDRWYLAEVRETHVRIFEEIIRGLFGKASRSEAIGLSPACLLVVETDGEIEQVDALKSSYDGAASTGLDVRANSFDEALVLPQFAARQIGTSALSEKCQRCELRTVCGGGHYPHRYRRGLGFRQPSVYCEDLTLLIRHIHHRVRADVEVRPAERSA